MLSGDSKVGTLSGTHLIAFDVLTKLYKGEKDEEEAKKLGILKEKKESPYSLGNICWFLAAIAAFYYLDFPTACLYDPRVKR